jgi:hypothetical protein
MSTWAQARAFERRRPRQPANEPGVCTRIRPQTSSAPRISATRSAYESCGYWQKEAQRQREAPLKEYRRARGAEAGANTTRCAWLPSSSSSQAAPHRQRSSGTPWPGRYRAAAQSAGWAGRCPFGDWRVTTRLPRPRGGSTRQWPQGRTPWARCRPRGAPGRASPPGRRRGPTPLVVPIRANASHEWAIK